MCGEVYLTFKACTPAPPGLRAVVSFHGVVDGYVPHDLTATGGSEGSAGAEAVAAPPITARALLCHAEADPFVPRDGVDACLAALGERGCRWELQAFGAAGGARQRTSPPP